MSERAREAFVRWQGRTLDQFSFVSNLILGLSTAAVGLSASAVLDRKVPEMGVARWALFVGVGLSAIATLAGVGLAWNRLLDFRKTMQAVKARREALSQVHALRSQEAKELGKASWRLLALQTACFVLSLLALLAFVVLQS